MLIPFLADATAALRFDSLGLSPVALDLGFLQIRWYSLAYIAGILIGWWYLLKLIDRPGAPMARRHADDLVFYATLGILIGGRLAYVLFYQPQILRHPIDVLKLWEGGMSFHGGVDRRHPRRSSCWRARTGSTGCASTIMSPAACRSGCSSAASPTSSTASCGAGRPTCRGR